MRGDVVPRDPPVVGPCVSGRGEEPGVQIGTARHRRRAEGVIHAAREDDESEQRGDRRDDRDGTQRPLRDVQRRRPPGAGAVDGRGDRGGDEAEDRKLQREPVPCPRGGVERGTRRSQRRRARREPDPGGCEGRERRPGRDRTPFPRVGGDEDGQADGEREPCAPAERQVLRHGERRDDGRRDDSRAARFRRGAEREQKRDHREDPEGVPVADRACQLAGRWPDGAEMLGDEARSQPPKRCGARADEHGGGECSSRAPGGQKQQRGEGSDVDDVALRLEDASRRALGPQRG